MDEKKHGKKSPKAYENEEFIGSPDGRIIRIMAEMLEPMHRFRRERIRDSIVMFGSARTLDPQDALKELKAEAGDDHETVAATWFQIGVVQVALCEYDGGMDAFITKPYSNRTVIACVNELTGQSVSSDK